MDIVGIIEHVPRECIINLVLLMDYLAHLSWVCYWPDSHPKHSLRKGDWETVYWWRHYLFAAWLEQTSCHALFTRVSMQQGVVHTACEATPHLDICCGHTKVRSLHLSMLTGHYCHLSFFLHPRLVLGVVTKHTKAHFVNFSGHKIFDLAKIPVRLFQSYSYLAGATASELRWLLPNVNVMLND